MRFRGAIAVALVLAACGTTPTTSDGPVPTASPPASAASPSDAAPATDAPTPTATPEPLAWTQLDVAGPEAREDHTWTVAGDGRTALLFGGRNGTTTFDDLWAYNLDADSWTDLSPPGGPTGRFGHEAAWVDGVGLVIFAGQAGATFFNDLWAYDPDAAEWRELPAAGDVPVPRYGTCAAVGADGRLWISHGFTSDGVRFSDTVAYDFGAGTWSDETPAGERPVERCLHGCWWTTDGSFVLFAGQTTGTTALGDRWALEGGSWSESAASLPGPRNLYARARLDGATLIFGGLALDGSYLADLWVLPDGPADAIKLAPMGEGPTGRAGAEMIVDPQSDRVLLVGGRDGNGGRADLWVLSGAGR